jgi:SAM-dependent methyltransferase
MNTVFYMVFQRFKKDSTPTTSQKETLAAKIEILDTKIQFLRVNSTFNIPLNITNESQDIFPAYSKNEKTPVNLSYRWLDREKKIMENEGLRTFLPCDLEPSEKITLYAIVKAPNKAGDYFLEFDLVKEYDSWFNIKNPTTLMPIKVLRRDLFSYAFWYPDNKENFPNLHHITGGVTQISFEENNLILNLQGWALSTTNGAPVDSVSILLDSTFLGAVILGDERKDIANESLEYLKCGWHGKFKLPHLKPGYHLLEIYVRAGHELFSIVHANRIISVTEDGTMNLIDESYPGFLTPIPSPDLRQLVAGMDDKNWFIKGGALAAYSIERTLKSVDKKFDDLEFVLDFGCGCGRVLSHLQNYNKTKFFGTDYNSLPIDWCKQNLPFANFGTNSLKPPLSYDDEMFDLVYAFSVLTHLTIDTQKEWILELTRILKNGGFLLVSTHGDFERGAIIDSLDRKKFDNGNIIVRDSLKEGENICMANHPFGSISTILPSNLKLVSSMLEGAKGNPRQDIHLLQKFP